MSLRTISVFVILAGVTFFGSSLWAEDFNIYFKASPRPELLYPYSDPATLTLLVTAADGRPVAQGRVMIRLEAPKPARWFSTDFPVVEGSRLMDMALPLRLGRAEWKYLFPIRGEYRLSVEFAAPDGRTASKTFRFGIRENRQKWLILGGFSLTLFAVGAMAGRIFTGSVRTKGIAACLFVAIGCLPLLPQHAAAQNRETGEYFGGLDIEPATVGKPANLRWKLAGDKSAEKMAALLTLTITHIEKEKTVFAVERLPLTGEFAMEFQFTDGAEYRVAAVAYVAGRPVLRTEKNVAVTAVEPPARAMIPALSYFVALIALGLGVGRWSKRRRIKS